LQLFLSWNDWKDLLYVLKIQMSMFVI
jgi:hypothetical protein